MLSCVICILIIGVFNLQIVDAQSTSDIIISSDMCFRSTPVREATIEMNESAGILDSGIDSTGSSYILTYDRISGRTRISLIKIASNGTLIFMKEWMDSDFNIRDFEIANEYVYLLTSNDSEWYPRYELIKMDLYGNTLEHQLLNFTSYNFYPISIQINSQDSMFIQTHNPATMELTIFKMNMTGGILWNYTTPKPEIDFAALSDGRLIVADNESASFFGTEGNLEWQCSLRPSDDASSYWFLKKVLLMDDDTFLISFNMYLQGCDRLFRFNADGTTIWNKTVRGEVQVGGVTDAHIENLLLGLDSSVYLVANVFGTTGNPFLITITDNGTQTKGWMLDEQLLFNRVIMNPESNPILIGIERYETSSTLLVYFYDLESTTLPIELNVFYLIAIPLLIVAFVIIIYFGKKSKAVSNF